MANVNDGSQQSAPPFNPIIPPGEIIPVTPEMFGANGTFSSDTIGIQAACSYVKDNYINVSGKRNCAGVTFQPRAYYLDESVDYTDDGTRPGMTLIGNFGSLGTIIYTNLSEAYPAIDMTGVANAFVSGLSITPYDQNDKSSCKLLLANTDESHCNVPHIEYCNFGGSAATLEGSVAALVVQGGDLAIFNDVQCSSNYSPNSYALVYGSHLPTFYHGYGVVAGSTVSVISLNVSGSFNNDPTQLGQNVVGMPVYITSGTNDGYQGVITDYNVTGGHTLVTVSPDLDAPCDATSFVYISSIASKYKTLNNAADNTLAMGYNLRCDGTKAGVLLTGANMSFFGSYFTCGQDGNNIAPILLDNILAQPDGNTLGLYNCRCENESANASVCAVMTYVGCRIIETHNFYPAVQGNAIFGCANGGGIDNIIANLEGDDVTPLLDILDAAGAPKSIITLTGNMTNVPSVGTVQSISNVNVTGTSFGIGDFYNLAYAGNVKGDQIIPAPGVHTSNSRLAGTNAQVSPVAAMQRSAPAGHNTTGGSSQLRYSYTIPANTLNTLNYFKTLTYKVTGDCGGTMTACVAKINQAATATAVAGSSGAVTAGNIYTFEIEIYSNGGAVGDFSWSGSLYNGTVCVARWAGRDLPNLDATQDFTIDVYENAAGANSLGFYTNVTRVG